jgi:acyl carrier protein
MTAEDVQLGNGGPPDGVMIIRGQRVHPPHVEHIVERSHPALRPGFATAFSVTLDGEERLVVVDEIEPARHGEADAALQAIHQTVMEEGGVRPYIIVLIGADTMPKCADAPRRHVCRDAFLTDSLDRVAEWRGPFVVEEEPEADATPTPSQAEIEAWLSARLSETLGAPLQRINLDATLSQYGVDSAAAAGIAGQLEDWLGRRLSPTLLFNYPTVRTLAAHLSGAPDAPPPADAEEEAEQAAALEHLQELSEGDLERLLEERLRLLGDKDVP